MDAMWDVLWPVFGVILGFAAGWATKWGLARREESRALNELVTYLHLKRLLAPTEPQEGEPGPVEARYRTSVRDIRENLVESLAYLQPGSEATEILMRMSAACNRYLRATRTDPSLYQFELMELRRNLDEDLRILTDSRRDVQYLSPGEAPIRRGHGHAATAATAGRPGFAAKDGAAEEKSGEDSTADPSEAEPANGPIPSPH